MSLYRNIRAICGEFFEIHSDFTNTKTAIEHLKKTGKHNVGYQLAHAVKYCISYRNTQKKNIICAILGISEIEYKEVIFKTTHVQKLGYNKFIFLENEFKLKEYNLHSNSINMICDLLAVELN